MDQSDHSPTSDMSTANYPDSVSTPRTRGPTAKRARTFGYFAVLFLACMVSAYMTQIGGGAALAVQAILPVSLVVSLIICMVGLVLHAVRRR